MSERKYIDLDVLSSKVYDVSFCVYLGSNDNDESTSLFGGAEINKIECHEHSCHVFLKDLREFIFLSKSPSNNLLLKVKLENLKTQYENSQNISSVNKKESGVKEMFFSGGDFFHLDGQLQSLKDIASSVLKSRSIMLIEDSGRVKKISFLTEEEAIAMQEEIVSFLKNKMTLNIFKDVANSNPLLSPQEAWTRAEEIYLLLETKRVAGVY